MAIGILNRLFGIHGSAQPHISDSTSLNMCVFVSVCVDVCVSICL